MSLDASDSPVAETPLRDFSQLVDYFRQGETPPEQWRVGMEHEKIGVLHPSLRRVPYEGECTYVRATLGELCAWLAEDAATSGALASYRRDEWVWCGDQRRAAPQLLPLLTF